MADVLPVDTIKLLAYSNLCCNKRSKVHRFAPLFSNCGLILMTSLKDFTEKWCDPKYPPEAVLESDLNAIEVDFGINLPMEYREQVIAIGLPSPTLALLSAICDREVDLDDLSRLYNPTEVKKETIGWREAGLPNNLLVIGSDGMGNKFCFDLADLKKHANGKVPVYFWDHDFLETNKIAPSFSDWIDAFQGTWSDGVSYADF